MFQKYKSYKNNPSPERAERFDVLKSLQKELDAKNVR